MPRIEVEPVEIIQPERLSRQQRRAAEKQEAKKLASTNKRLAIIQAAKLRKAKKVSNNG